ncbi:unnamed protein product [Malus baccata var. baccata]
MADLVSTREISRSGLVKSQFQGIFDKGNVEVADPKANKLITDTSSDLKGIRSSVLRFCWICNVCEWIWNACII